MEIQRCVAMEYSYPVAFPGILINRSHCSLLVFLGRVTLHQESRCSGLKNANYSINLVINHACSIVFLLKGRREVNNIGYEITKIQDNIR